MALSIATGTATAKAIVVIAINGVTSSFIVFEMYNTNVVSLPSQLLLLLLTIFL